VPPTGTSQLLIEPLSEREHEILHFLAAGLTNQGIADTLFLAESTVKWHIKHIYAKLAVHNRTQAVARARALQLLA
jgi:ATP/maltotriose-dependent transcriptional regulator MalT